MAPPTRRALLGASASAAFLAGCATFEANDESGSDQPTATETTTRTDTPTRAPFGPSTLDVEASVVQPATAEGPAVIETVLTNRADRTVHVLPHAGGGRALDHPIRLPGETVELVLLPDGFPGLAEEPTDTCWRFAPPEGGELGTRTVVATSVPTELRPGERLEQPYEVYQDGSAEACFPDASYETTWSFDLAAPEGERVSLDVMYRLTASSDGDLAATTEGPTH